MAKILIVEPNSHIVTELRELLGKSHNLTVVSNTDQARALLTPKEVGIKLVIVAEVVVGGSGPKFVRELKKSFPGVKTILIGQGAQPRRTHGDAFVEKPDKLYMLEQIVQQLLANL